MELKKIFSSETTEVKVGKSSKFIKNPIIYVKKLIIMLIQFKFGGQKLLYFKPESAQI
jgi:hypothetical protein